MLTEKEKKIAMDTSKTKVPVVPICYRVVKSLGINGSALDFGCGKHKMHTHILGEAGAKHVVAYDLHFPESRDEAFSQKFDCIVASNVINVQSSMSGLRHTLEEIASCLNPGGYAIVNYPADPRKMEPKPLSVSEMTEELAKTFSVEKVGKDLSGNTPVFILRI